MVVSIYKTAGKHQNEPMETFDQDLAWKLRDEEEKIFLEKSGKAPHPQSGWDRRG